MRGRGSREIYDIRFSIYERNGGRPQVSRIAQIGEPKSGLI